MVATLRAAWGPEVNDYELYDPDGIAGYDIILGTDIPSPVLPSGTYAFRAVNVAAGATMLRGPVADNFSAQSYTWHVLRHFRADGTFTASTKFGIWQLWAVTSIPPEAHVLRGVGQSDGKYKVALWGGSPVSTQHAISSSSYSSAEWINIRTQYDGSRCKIWINGTLEIDFATASRPTNGRIQLFWLASATVTKYWSGYACVTSSSESDRPGTDLGRHRLDPDGNTADTDYGDEVDCTDAALGDFDNWDDWAGGGQHDGATHFNCDGAAAGTEISTLTTATLSDDVLGVIHHQMRRANEVDKVMNNYAVLQYSGTESEIQMDNAGGTYFPNSAAFPDAPGGGAWADEIDGLEAGVRTPGGNEASFLVTAVGIEVFTIDADPPPPSGVSTHIYAAQSI